MKKSILSLLLVAGLTTSLMALAKDGEENHSYKVCAVADFESFTAAANGSSGSNHRIIPCHLMNPANLTASSAEIPATCTVDEKMKSTGQKCVASDHVAGKG